MANALYPKWKEGLLQATTNTALTGTLKVALVDTGTYTYSAAHQFWSSVTGTQTPPTPVALGTKTYTNGVLGAANTTFTAVSNGSVSIEALVFYVDTGTAGTSPLVAYIDTGVTNLPVTPNGGDIVVTWNGSGIFGL